MSNGGPGKKRSPGIDILLFVVTLSVYWFVWNYKAFREFGEHRGRDLKPGTWIPILAILWVATIGVLSYGVMTAAEVPSGATIEEQFQMALEDAARPVMVAGVALSILFYILQLFYQKPATAAVREAATDHSLDQSANPTLAVLFNVFFAIGQAIPLLGSLLGLVALIIAIVWVVQVQKTLNEYWDRAAFQYPAQQPAYEAAPGGYGAGAPYVEQRGSQQASPQPHAGGSAQQAPAEPGSSPSAEAEGAEPAQPEPRGPTEEKTFACPNCGTHVTVNYTPGTPTPVQCHSCGQRGNIK